MAGTPVMTYAATLRTLANQLGLALGCDITQLPKDVRVSDFAGLAAVAIVCRAIVDKGLLTNADLQAAVTAAQAETWPNEPI